MSIRFENESVQRMYALSPDKPVFMLQHAGDSHHEVSESPKSEETKREDFTESGTSPPLKFLDDFFGNDQRVLSAIKKTKPPSPPIVETFTAADREGPDNFIRKHQAAGRDIYFSPNPCKRAMDKKPNKDDVRAATHLWIDLDPRTAEVTAGRLPEERAAMLSLLTDNLPKGLLRPNRVVDSGRGYWGFWKLDKPALVDGWAVKPARGVVGIPGELTTHVENYGKGIEQAFGDRFADGCRNIDRIARLPYTTNSKTGERGCVLAQYSNDDPHAIESFPCKVDKAKSKSAPDDKAGPVDELDSDPRTKNLTARCRQIIRAGGIMGETAKHCGDKGDASRSAWLYDAVFEMQAAGLSKGLTRAIVTDKRFLISAIGNDKPHEIDNAIEKVFQRGEERDNAFGVAEMAEMNRDYAAGAVRGKFRIIAWRPDARYPMQRTTDFFSHDDFLHTVRNPGVVIGMTDEGIPRRVPRGEYWIRQSKRSEYDDIDFKPGKPAMIETINSLTGRVRRVANMYSGFAVEADHDNSESKCKLFLAHVRDNIAGGDKDLNRYILDWMASGVQQPDDPGRSSLSMRGEPGSGKGAFATYYGEIFGRHFLHATHKDHVTGKFNAHQAESCLIFVDEALYADIKSDAQILKTLTSEKRKVLERKGIDAVQVDNYARLIFATNDDHPIMIEHNDRRYCAIYVRTNPAWANMSTEAAAGPRKLYFDPYYREMRDGGRAALLGLLLDRDISKFNPEAIPMTTERNTQILLSAPAGDKIVIEFAQEARLPGAIGKGSKKDVFDTAPARSRTVSGETYNPGLYSAMAERGLKRASENELADILKAWGFVRRHGEHGTEWQAPALGFLQAAINAKYPAVIWDDPLATEWRS